MSAAYASSSSSSSPPSSLGPASAQPQDSGLGAAGASRELNTRFFVFSVGLSVVFWVCFIFTFVAQYGLLSTAWFVPLILLVIAWLGHLIETMTSRSRRAFSTAGVASDVERWCDEYRATYPHFVYTVSCYHYETRTRTVRDANGNYRTETYTVRVNTYSASDTIVPTFCVNCVFGEDTIAAPRTLITFHLDVEAGDQESAAFLEQYRAHLYSENCWRDTHCDVGYTRDIPGWRGRYAALFPSEEERARASQLMLIMFAAGAVALSWVPRLWVHKNFGSHDISVAKRYFFSSDASRLRTLLQSGVEMFQDAMERNHRAIVERHRKAAESGPFGSKPSSADDQQQQQQQQQQQDAQAAVGTAPLSPATAVPPPAYWMPSASYSVCVPNTAGGVDASPTMYAFDASQKHFVPYSSSAPAATPTAAYVPPPMPAAAATAPPPTTAAMPAVVPPTWGASAAVPAASVSVSATATPAVGQTYASYSYAVPQAAGQTLQFQVQPQLQAQPQAQPQQTYVAYGSSGYSTAVASTATPTSPPPQYVVQPV